MTNEDVARTLEQIGDILEIEGENHFRVLGYRRGAESIRALPRDVNEVWQAGELGSIPGIGAALTQKIDELLRTGRLQYLEKLYEKVPPGVISLVQIPGVGPAKARALWEQLGIADIEQAEEAARAGKLRGLPGFGARTEAKILAEIETLRRRSTARRAPIGDALPAARSLLASLAAAAPAIVHAEVAGSLRRWQETIGDIDLVVATAEPEAVMAAFKALPQVSEVLLSGATRTSVRVNGGLQVDLRALEPARWGTALQYFTGSQAHNVELRELAQRQGWSLSEYELKSTATGEARLFADEAGLYEALGLAWIPPELREGRGEIAAAAARRLPRLVTVDDIRGDLHAHTVWSDGKNTLAQMAAAAQARGYRYFAFTDHSQSLTVAGGMSGDAWHRQREELAEVRARFPDLLILQGAEVEVRADGTLDYADEMLAEMDIVIAAVHVSHRQPRDQITARALNAVRNPHVDVLAHPSGRLLGQREPSQLDLEAVIQAAAEMGTILEINANPARLDLDDIHARRAVELSVPLAIDTDAHSPADLDYLEYGVAVARRAWAEPANIVNTWPPESLLVYLKERRRPS